MVSRPAHHHVRVEGTNKVTAGSVDLYLVFDLLVGLAPNNLVGVSPDRTVAVARRLPDPDRRHGRRHARHLPRRRAPARPTSTTPPGPTTTSTSTPWRSPRASSASRPPPTRSMLGVAYQLGGVPISAEAIEQAIELNGAAVEVNQLAFRWGRMLVVDPDRVRAASILPEDHLPKPSPADRDRHRGRRVGEGELGRLLRMRVPDLVAYQDEAYARRYVDGREARPRRARPGGLRRGRRPLPLQADGLQGRVRGGPAAPRGGRPPAGGERRRQRRQGRYNLHPPMLRAMGLDQKVRLWAVVHARAPEPPGRQAAAGHPARPVRLRQGPPGRAVARQGVPPARRAAGANG